SIFITSSYPNRVVNNSPYSQGVVFALKRKFSPCGLSDAQKNAEILRDEFSVSSWVKEDCSDFTIHLSVRL
ncbi:MAG: hypothetical protein K2X39_00555, partial [Silvanigrellaceae bacterium]|nr:hypothetical protein [Silvanigrellaceae bacterium]